MVNVVLVEPEIPQNAGNAARTCACTGARLHLVEPMGFQLTHKRLARAAMDYWDDAHVRVWPSAQAFFEAHEGADMHLFTSHATLPHTRARYADDTYLVFGRESRGLDAGLLDAHAQQCVRIPMAVGERSLNLANSVAVGVYEVLRQRGFAGMV